MTMRMTDDQEDSMDTTMEMNEERRVERAEIVFDSDAVCEGCGVKPTEEAIDDPRWSMEQVLCGRADNYWSEARIRCPGCW